MEKNQICRMKADGSGYEVLGWGQSPTIYKVLFCKLNDAPVVTLNDAVTV